MYLCRFSADFPMRNNYEQPLALEILQGTSCMWQSEDSRFLNLMLFTFFLSVWPSSRTRWMSEQFWISPYLLLQHQWCPHSTLTFWIYADLFPLFMVWNVVSGQTDCTFDGRHMRKWTVPGCNRILWSRWPQVRGVQTSRRSEALRQFWQLCVWVVVCTISCCIRFQLRPGYSGDLSLWTTTSSRNNCGIFCRHWSVCFWEIITHIPRLRWWRLLRTLGSSASVPEKIDFKCHWKWALHQINHAPLTRIIKLSPNQTILMGCCDAANNWIPGGSNCPYSDLRSRWIGLIVGAMQEPAVEVNVAKLVWMWGETNETKVFVRLSCRISLNWGAWLRLKISCLVQEQSYSLLRWLTGVGWA